MAGYSCGINVLLHMAEKKFRTDTEMFELQK